MAKADHRKISKLMSFALRHDPSHLGLKLDPEGWTYTTELLAGLNRKRLPVDMKLLEEVVATNDKKRFSFNEDKTKIRANQGHSIAIDLQLVPKVPPEVLYHGTVERFLESITTEGLKKMGRQHVHLSADYSTAQNVGGRRGRPIILFIDAVQMHEDGHSFFQSDNGVWLTDHVPPKYVKREHGK